MLLLRQGDADDLGAAGFCQIKRKAAPAGADIEHPHAGLDGELRGEVALLGVLGVLERAVRRLEIGAGILPVAIEEELVDAPVDVVVMRHVAAGEANRVALVQPAQRHANLERDLHPEGRFDRRCIAEHQRQEIIDRALLDRQAAIHVGFADREVGVEHQPERGLAVAHPDDDLLAGAVAEGELPAIRLPNRQVPALDNMGEHPAQAAEHGTLVAKSTPLFHGERTMTMHGPSVPALGYCPQSDR
jgi:hypothetical protein